MVAAICLSKSSIFPSCKRSLHEIFVLPLCGRMENIMIKYPHLFQPIEIAGTLFKNRIFAAPTGYMDMDREGILNDAAALYYGRKAQGGAAAVTLGECVVDSELAEAANTI
jgi:hypothetical protein